MAYPSDFHIQIVLWPDYLETTQKQPLSISLVEASDNSPRGACEQKDLKYPHNIHVFEFG
jgi:hypothetical protein